MRGQFSPIESVIADAERLAEAEWKRDHEPCPHDILERALCDRYPHCIECGAVIPDE